MKKQTLSGKILSLNISPKGAMESFLLKTAKGTCQVNLPKGAEMGRSFARGENCSITARPFEDDRPSHHPVYELEAEGDDEGTGVIDHLNYARHGEPNGAVLKDGSFLHMKPGGMKAAGVKAGQKITYKGERRTAPDGQVVIEVTEVNGKKLDKKPAKKPEKKKKR